MRHSLDDVRFALRLLRKQPGFTFLATACLALGIGANASIFSLLNTLLLRTLPVRDANSLVVLQHGKNSRFSFPNYDDLATRFRNSGTLLATLPTEFSLDRPGHQGQLVTAEAVTGNYARVLKVGTTLGDWFDNENAPVAVISYNAWQTLFQGDPGALGQQVRSETQWYTVVGVAPEEFTGLSSPTSTGIWVPLHIWTRQHPNMQARLNDRDSPLVRIFGRLASSIPIGDATAQLGAIEMRLNRESVRHESPHDAITAEIARGVTASGDRVRLKQVLTLLFAIVATLLLICCVNVGNLLLVRGAARQKELAIRYSLGATRSRIVQQLLTDSFLLAVIGGVGGLLINALLVRLILRLVPDLPLGENISPSIPLDWRVLGFVAGSALASVFLFGLLPAWHASAYCPWPKSGSTLGTHRGVTLRRSSVVAQVALSFVLLFVAGLFLDTCWRLQDTNPGFAVRNRLYATTYVSKPELAAQQIPGFYQRVLTNLNAEPGVRAAGLTYLLPLGASESECVKNPDSAEVQATSSTTSPGFLRTMGIPLLQGRDFDNSDGTNTQSVVLINQMLATKLWPRISPIGHQIQIGCRERFSATVEGVVSNSKTASLGQGFQPHVYRAFAQNATGLANIVIEASGLTTAQFRRALLSQGHGMRVYAVNSLSEHVEQSFWQLRWESWLLGAFGSAALFLAGLGLYGLTSYSTTLRIKEFGLRMALGAQPGDILRLVVREALALGAVGVCLGATAAISLTSVLHNVLLQANLSVPFACLSVSGLWLTVITAASYLPARRSSHAEPSTALGYD